MNRLATAPVLMTFNDMCGFFFALSLASALLYQLTPWCALTGMLAAAGLEVVRAIALKYTERFTRL